MSKLLQDGNWLGLVKFEKWTCPSSHPSRIQSILYICGKLILHLLGRCISLGTNQTMSFYETMSHSSSSAFYQHKTNLLLKSLSYMYMLSFCTTWQTWIIFQFSLLIFAYLILSLECLTLILACLLLINEKLHWNVIESLTISHHKYSTFISG